MELTLCLSTQTPTFFSISKARSRHFITTKLPTQLVTCRRISCIYSHTNRTPPFASSSSFRGLSAVVPLARQSRLECFSSSAASFGTAAGGGGGGGSGDEFGGSGGGGGSEGGDVKSNLVAGVAEEVSALSQDVIILDVGGMTCGGCAASVKRILESQPQVSSASVDLTTETAIVWPVSEAKVVPNWQEQLGEALAKHLTSCGFTSNLRGQGAIEGDISP